MAAAATKPDPGTQFLQDIAADNPAATPLSDGLHTDPTYAAFLRGIGYSYSDSVQKAMQQMTAARTTYDTQVSRLPEQLHQAQEATDTGLMDRGVYNSGERLVRENRNVVADQQTRQDLATQKASALSAAQGGLQSAIADLARQRADAEGDLQNRQEQRVNQDKYIAAVRGAASGGGGGGGGNVNLTLPGAPGPGGALAPKPATASAGITGGSYSMPDAGAQPAMAAGQHINDYLNSQPVFDYFAGLDAPGQNRFTTFVRAQHPDADFGGLVRYVASRKPAPATSVGNGQRVG